MRLPRAFAILLVSLMHALTLHSAIDHRASTHGRQRERTAHRLLVVSEGGLELAYGERVAESLSRHIPEVDVQHLSIDALLSRAAQSAEGEVLTISSALSILNRFQLILATTEHVRHMLCIATPSLSERIYRLDHFDNSCAAEGRLHAASSVEGGGSCEAWVRHWSICMSQLISVRPNVR